MHEIYSLIRLNWLGIAITVSTHEFKMLLPNMQGQGVGRKAVGRGPMAKGIPCGRIFHYCRHTYFPSALKIDGIDSLEGLS